MIYYPEMSLTEPEKTVEKIRVIEPWPWWVKGKNCEEAKQQICDEICKWPSEYKDPDDLWNEKCDQCMIMQFLDEVKKCLKQG